MSRDNVKIPAKHYVGLVKRGKPGLPFGFMTPWGSDAAGAKRMATVNNWARGTNALAPMVIDNVPMSGFKLTSSIRTTDYGGYDHWRVEDPRGFELEISGGNLAQPISVGMVDRGEFMDECVWARHGSNNVLLSTATEEYKAAIENTRVAALKSNWKDVKLGNHVVLQNNLRGVWLGRMYGVVKAFNNHYVSTFGNNELEPYDKIYHVIYSQSTSSNGAHALHLIVGPKLSYIDDAVSVLTPADAELKVNELLADKSCFTIMSGYSSPILLSFDRIVCGSNLNLVLAPIDIDNEQDMREMTTGYDSDRIMVRKASGKIGLLQTNHANSNITMISEEHLYRGEFRRALVKNTDSRSKYRYSSQNFPFVDDNEEYVFNHEDEFFKLEMQVSTSAGNTIVRALPR